LRRWTEPASTVLLHALSIGHGIDICRPQTGVVHSAFDRAANLLMAGELWTVLGAARPDAPFGIRLAPGDGAARLNVRVNDPVNVRAGHVSVGRLIIDCRTASCWVPTGRMQLAPGLEVRLGILEQRARSRAWAESASMAHDVTEALGKAGSAADAELVAAVRRTIGRGPGLTPAGDDVLVGILGVLGSAAAGPENVSRRARLIGALAPVLASTSDVSRHLLDQVARGLPGRALHDLGRAVIEGAPDDVMEKALDVLLDTGCTSGADACMGLAAACRLMFFITDRAAA